LFAPVAGQQFDFVVSNPPYIPHDDIARLAPGVRDYEPHRALDGGPTGYEVLDKLAAEAKGHLKPGGCLIVEIGAPQETEARPRLEQKGFELAATVLDYSGHPRVLVGKLPMV
jgi:release factor glutamine methyltransferase